MTQVIIFTDIDGTAIDEKYSFKDSKNIIKKMHALNVPIVLCSSKTKAEIEYYQETLGINDPFISENGAAIYIPKGYFNANFKATKQTKKYDIIELGIPYLEIRKKFEFIKLKIGFPVLGFGDMTVSELAQDTGLSFKLAALAKQREYSEPVKLWTKDEAEELKFLELLHNEGLNCVFSGKYFHLTGYHDKGAAVEIIRELYSSSLGWISTISVGNASNDLPMLKVTDYSFFVDKNASLGAVWSLISRMVGDILKPSSHVIEREYS